MASPITSIEIVESIRFFGEVVATPFISDKVKEKCNEYLERLVNALEPAVDETTAKASGIKLLK